MKQHRIFIVTFGCIFFAFAGTLVGCNSQSASNASSSSSPVATGTPPGNDGDPVGPRQYSNMKSVPPMKSSTVEPTGIPLACVQDSMKCTWTIHFETSDNKPSPPLPCQIKECFTIYNQLDRTEEDAGGTATGTPTQYWVRATISARQNP